jgi:hypothetical protein
MRELDIDACLAQAPDEEPFWIEIEDEIIFPEGGPKFQLKISWEKYHKIFRQYYTPRVEMGRRSQQGGGLQLQGDDFKFGLAMAEYIIDWEGIKGKFDQQKVIKWFRKFPNVCVSFGDSLGVIFQEREEQALKYQEESEKNSEATPSG